MVVRHPTYHHYHHRHYYIIVVVVAPPLPKSTLTFQPTLNYANQLILQDL